MTTQPELMDRSLGPPMPPQESMQWEPEPQLAPACTPQHQQVPRPPLQQPQMLAPRMTTQPESASRSLGPQMQPQQSMQWEPEVQMAPACAQQVFQLQPQPSGFQLQPQT